MPTATEIPSGSATFWDVSRGFYERFLAEFQDRSASHTCGDGVPKIGLPVGLEHEGSKKWLSSMLQALAELLRIPIRCVGSLAIRNRRQAKEIEADECFCVAHEPALRGRPDVDPDRDPPPNRAIEADWTSASHSRLPVDARPGGPEVWRYAHERRFARCLTPNGEYEESDRSQALLFLPPDEFQEFTLHDPDIDETSWIRRFRVRVRRRLSHDDSEERA
jgi:hypothetical protein